MTLEQAIRNADAVKPNTFSDEAKTLWLNECEGMVQKRVMLVPAGEYDKYNNAIAVFNAHFNEYMRWYANRYRPADRRNET